MTNNELKKSQLVFTSDSGKIIVIAYKIETSYGGYKIGYLKDNNVVAAISFAEFTEQFVAKPALKDFNDPLHLIP